MKSTITAFIYIVFIGVYLNSCTHQNEKEVYREKATMLIEQILAKEDFNCLVLRSSNEGVKEIESSIPSEELEEIIMSEVGFTSSLALQEAIRNSEGFQLKSSILDSKIKIFDGKMFDSILVKGNEDFKNGKITHRLGVIRRLCPTPIVTIYNPIFSPNFKKALVYIQYSYSCLKMPFYVYKLNGNVWE